MPKDIETTLVFLRRKGELLLAVKKRGHGAGKWNGMGGKIDPGETIEQAMVRECQEEVCVTPLRWQHAAKFDFVMDADSDQPWHIYMHAFLCDEWQGTPTETEEMRPQWFALAHIPYDDMWEDDRLWLPRVLRGEKLNGTFTFDGKQRMMHHHITPVQELSIETFAA